MNIRNMIINFFRFTSKHLSLLYKPATIIIMVKNKFAP